MMQALLAPVMRLLPVTGWSLAISASIRLALAYALYAPAE